ncbi:MAG TPA: S8 family serine peptidase, partial [Fontimonas sp.]
MRIRTPAFQLCCAALLCASSTLASAALLQPDGSPSAQTPEPVDVNALAATGLGSSLPLPEVINADGTIPDQYIVTLKPQAGAPLQASALETQIQALLKRVGGGEILAVYDAVFPGFAVRIPAAKAALLKLLPQVADIEPDRLISASSVQHSPPSWGLDRIDQRDLPLDDTYHHPDWEGRGAHIYIFDSGINPHHQEFSGRISTTAAAPHHIWVKAVASNPWDCHGHGTYVASIAAGTHAGVAKKATLHSIRVLGCNGKGANSGTIAAMDWLVKNAQQPAVANMSLGGPTSAAVNKAARAMVNANIAVSVAAGNENQNACNVSPASEGSVVTVGGTSKDDYRGYYSDGTGWYSNYGSCLDLFAPGSDIVGAAHNNNTGGVMGSGTSAASPHVAGALAIWRARFPSTSGAIIQNGVVQYHTTPDRVQ